MSKIDATATDSGLPSLAAVDALATAKAVSPRKRKLKKLLRNRGAMIAIGFLILILICALFGPLLEPYNPNAIDILNRNASPVVAAPARHRRPRTRHPQPDHRRCGDRGAGEPAVGRRRVPRRDPDRAVLGVHRRDGRQRHHAVRRRRAQLPRTRARAGDRRRTRAECRQRRDRDLGDDAPRVHPSRARVGARRSSTRPTSRRRDRSGCRHGGSSGNGSCPTSALRSSSPRRSRSVARSSPRPVSASSACRCSRPNASWGNMLRHAYDFSLFTYPWQLVIPGAAIALTILAYNTLGDGLRDTLSVAEWVPARHGTSVRDRVQAQAQGEPRASRPWPSRAAPSPIGATTLLRRRALVRRGPERRSSTATARRVRVVDDVSFAVRRTEVLGLVGESGSGKTVTSLVDHATARLAARTDRVGARSTSRTATSSDGLRRDAHASAATSIAMVFQDPMAASIRAFTSATSSSRRTGSTTTVEPGDGRTARARGAGAGADPGGRAAVDGLPPPAVRWDAPAGHARDGAHLRTEAAHRRRAHDRARRDRAGPDPRPAPLPPARARPVGHLRHARPRRGRRSLRPRRGDVRRADRRAGDGTRAVLAPAPPVHRGTAAGDAAGRQPARRSLRDPRCRPLGRGDAHRVSLPSPLRVRTDECVSQAVLLRAAPNGTGDADATPTQATRSCAASGPTSSPSRAPNDVGAGRRRERPRPQRDAPRDALVDQGVPHRAGAAPARARFASTRSTAST